MLAHVDFLGCAEDPVFLLVFEEISLNNCLTLSLVQVESSPFHGKIHVKCLSCKLLVVIAVVYKLGKIKWLKNQSL